MVVESLGRLVRSDEYAIQSIEAGSADGIADEVTRLTADIAASDAVAAIHRATASMATADGFDGDVLAALDAGRVETLLVHDDGDAVTSADRYLDRCIARALSTGADIVVVPNVAILDRGVAAILRW
jgi:stalled ribosome rescue protein Dom34